MYKRLFVIFLGLISSEICASGSQRNPQPFYEYPGGEPVSAFDEIHDYVSGDHEEIFCGNGNPSAFASPQPRRSASRGVFVALQVAGRSGKKSDGAGKAEHE